MSILFIQRRNPAFVKMSATKLKARLAILKKLVYFHFTKKVPGRFGNGKFGKSKYGGDENMDYDNFHQTVFVHTVHVHTVS